MISILKGIRISKFNYTIDLNIVEIEKLRQILWTVQSQQSQNTESCVFADKLATLINNTLVKYGD